MRRFTYSCDFGRRVGGARGRIQRFGHRPDHDPPREHGRVRRTGSGASPYLLLWGGTEGAAALFCLMGIAGAGFAVARRSRTGAWLMLAGAAGVAVSAYAYVLLLPVAIGPAFEPYLSPGLLPVGQWHALALFPVPPLLLGAALALFSCGTPEDRPGPSESPV